MHRKPAVAGSFYPARPRELQASLESYLDQVKEYGKTPKAIIVPHAGYIYSAAIAASAYARLNAARETITKVILIGPSHHIGFQGLALTELTAYDTPLGSVSLDQSAYSQLLALPFVIINEAAHQYDHSLEVQLPFLQTVIAGFSLLPIMAGNASSEQVAEVIALLWGGEETLIVISSDLSHFLDYASAKQLDQQTSQLIEQLDYQSITSEAACGKVAICGLLKVIKDKALAIKTVDLRNSGDTAGNKQRVVGYGAYVVN